MKKKIVALGFFDGVHLGHQALLAACVSLARARNMRPAALTFTNHPKAAFGAAPTLLTGNEDRVALLRRYGAEEVVLSPVTEEVMSTEWDAFLDHLTEDGAAGFVCGEDFRFGRKGAGDQRKLRAYCAEKGLVCKVIPEQKIDGRRVSSTHIRELIEEGQMETAEKFLGHPHILTGCVVHGRHLGRTIGVPTANILIPEGVVVPKRGVYACKCSIDGEEFTAVTNVGSRPTVCGHQVRAESWIAQFDGDLYGRELTLEFYKFLRPEQKFASLDELKAQIQNDGRGAQAFFQSRKNSEKV